MMSEILVSVAAPDRQPFMLLAAVGVLRMPDLYMRMGDVDQGHHAGARRAS